jgi:hypothetical protein
VPPGVGGADGLILTGFCLPFHELGTLEVGV